MAADDPGQDWQEKAEETPGAYGPVDQETLPLSVQPQARAPQKT